MNDVMKAARDGPLLIIVGVQHDGAAYQLHPQSQRRVEKAYPGRELLRSVFLGHHRESDFPRLQAPHWQQVAALLTGLSEDEIMRLGGVRVYSPEQERVVWEWAPAATATRG
jgi:hypothetical protein